MRRLLPLTLLIPLLGLAGPVSAASAAPPCEQEPKSLAKELAAASLVFGGEVLGREKLGDEVAYDVKVTRVYRGERVTEQITVYSPATRGDCGVRQVAKGQSWMFLSSTRPERVVTYSYDGTTEATRKVVLEVKDVLGPGEKPFVEPEEPVTAELTNVADDGPENFWPLSLPGFLLVGIGLVVLAAARGLGRRADRHP